MTAICPYCNSPILGLALNPVSGKSSNGTSWNCVVFACPVCQKALSADLDMSALRKDLMTAIKSS